MFGRINKNGFRGIFHGRMSIGLIVMEYPHYEVGIVFPVGQCYFSGMKKKQKNTQEDIPSHRAMEGRGVIAAEVLLSKRYRL